MKKLISILFLFMFASSVFAAKLYTGGEKYEKDKVVALTLTLNGKMIEWVYKENIGQCLKSKRVAAREVGSTFSFSGDTDFDFDSSIFCFEIPNFQISRSPDF